MRCAVVHGKGLRYDDHANVTDKCAVSTVVANVRSFRLYSDKLRAKIVTDRVASTMAHAALLHPDAPDTVLVVLEGLLCLVADRTYLCRVEQEWLTHCVMCVLHVYVCLCP